ncbi:hypothetical protein O181_045934 [Austropuccinia psidii MF-1]|uniref:Uncharacterized protein n=1 Tax=Austropuccinia psidii MF-1 TaxID=1389203 RepID=A0A9Q3DN47_9BASI|nr:hypothetical protein [Austropuccinia psidii MF-1]
MVMCPDPPPDETPKLPPISALTTPYASTPPLLTIFMLLQHPQDETTMRPSPLLKLPHPCLIFSLSYNPYASAGPSCYASKTALIPPQASLHPPLIILMLVECLPYMPPTPLTILRLVECLPDMPPMLLTILMFAVASQHASNAAYHPYACSALPTFLQRPPHTGPILKAAYYPYTPAALSR